MWLVSGSKIGLGARAGGAGHYLGGCGTASRGVGTQGGGGGVFSLSLSRAPSEVTKWSGGRRGVAAPEQQYLDGLSSWNW